MANFKNTFSQMTNFKNTKKINLKVSKSMMLKFKIWFLFTKYLLECVIKVLRKYVCKTWRKPIDNEPDITILKNWFHRWQKSKALYMSPPLSWGHKIYIHTICNKVYNIIYGELMYNIFELGLHLVVCQKWLYLGLH